MSRNNIELTEKYSKHRRRRYLSPSFRCRTSVCLFAGISVFIQTSVRSFARPTNLFSSTFSHFCCVCMKIVLFSFHQSQSLFNQKNFYTRNGLFASKVFVYTRTHTHTHPYPPNVPIWPYVGSSTAAVGVYCRFHFDRVVCCAFIQPFRVYTRAYSVHAYRTASNIRLPSIEQPAYTHIH